ncbi:MAPEG family protein [Rhodanobacter aciditrophus]|uniref:MAPEG family protein n=1 Tax=Rhodanobacter aciditrophus TaxID=1623218 RepID=UPI003CF7F32D
MLQQLPALVTLLTVLLMAGTAFAVGHARVKYGIKAPATSGHPAFERAFRVQMNTLEAAVMFLPLLWLAAHYGLGGWAGIAGLVWVAGRTWYAAAYLREASKREGGFTLGALAWIAVLVLAVIGAGRALLAA